MTSSHARPLWLAACCVLLFAAGALLAFRWTASPPLAPEAAIRAQHGQEAIAPPATAPTQAEEPLQRMLAADLAPVPVAPPADFVAMIDRLCELGRRTAELAEQDEVDRAKANDQLARELFAELLEQFPDAGERAIAMLVGAVPTADAPAPADVQRRIVLQLVLVAECRRRLEDAVAADDRSRLDAVVTALLDCMPIHASLVSVGAAVLIDQPYVHLVHEPSVLALLQLAGAGEFPHDVAGRLLLTLWRNLQALGERSAGEILRLALLLLDDTDEGERLAACRHLLADPRFRQLVLAQLRERGDTRLAAELAELASKELPVDEALTVLRELTPLLQHTRGHYMGLGVRAPELLADAYREHLAADNQPDIRRELVMGAGMAPGGEGVALAQLALADDPSADVRMQAMFVLTIRGTPEQGERAILRLLDEPTITQDDGRLEALVLALGNLEHGDPNALDRVGQRMRAMSLPAEAREQLDRLLARSLPGTTSDVPAELRAKGFGTR